MYNNFLWKKAYILEFYKNDILQDAFAFSVPPQNEEFVHPQRVAETKTFSNVVFDDYGNDTVKINLSGTTINEELKYIYRGKLQHRTMTGTEEIFYLKNLIEKYGWQENLPGKKVVCYCLDNTTKEAKYFDVVINELKIHRSKENPIAYFYNLSMTSFPRKKETPKDPDFTAKIRKNIEDMKVKLEELENSLAFISETKTKYKNMLNSINKDIDEFVDAFLKSIDIIFNLTEDLTGFVEETTSFGDKIIASGKRISIGLAVNTYNFVLNLKDDVNSLVGNLITLQEDDIPQEMMELYQKDAVEIKDLLLIQGREIQNKTNETVSDIKRSNNTQTYSVIPGDADTDDKVVLVYGFKEKTIKENETFDSIAAEIYGNPELGVLIQMYNRKETLRPGEVVFIPILNKTENIAQNNEVYNLPDTYDIYGVDVDFREKMSFLNNDFKTIKKEENLDQAISARLTTILNSRVRNLVFGIQTEVGNSSMSSNYVLASIKKTLEDEPRIKEIENISFNSVTGGLNIKIEYKDINDFSRMWGGLVLW